MLRPPDRGLRYLFQYISASEKSNRMSHPQQQTSRHQRHRPATTNDGGHHGVVGVDDGDGMPALTRVSDADTDANIESVVLMPRAGRGHRAGHGS